MLRIIRILFIVIYVSTLIYIVFFARRRQRMHTLSRYELINTVPVINKIKEFLYVSKSDAKTKYNFYSNIFGNVFLFVPFPLLLLYLFSIPPSVRAVVISALFSIGIECLQFTFKAGVADVDDIILNTAGAVVGVSLMKLLSKLRAIDHA